MHTLKQAYRLMCSSSNRQQQQDSSDKHHAESQLLQLLHLSQTHLITLLQQLVEAERTQEGSCRP